MKKIICLFVMFLISNAVNAEEWEYVSLIIAPSHRYLTYPDGKKDVWNIKQIKEPNNFRVFAAARFMVDRGALAGESQTQKEKGFNTMLKKDFSQPINVINALGLCGFEMSGYTEISFFTRESHNALTFWFKRKILE